MTYFEVLVTVAYAAFADAPVDVAVVEVGLGGSWDATNVIDAGVSVILPIDIDHRHFLGDTVELIATEKSGIIKADGITVMALQPHDEVTMILRDKAAEVGARLVAEGVDYGITARDVAVGGQQISVRGLAAEYPDLFVPLHGAHQAQNVATAIAAVEAFLGGGEQPLDLEVLRAALATVESPGRLEIVDSAHNPHGARALRAALEDSFMFARTIGVLAILADKDATEMLETLEPVFDEVVVTRSTSPRALRPSELGALAEEVFGEQRVHVVNDLPDALDRAAELADEGGVSGGVIATGSVTTAAEVRMLLGTTDV
jgi:dihydrofolate synthase/folylpolyglutamate synthase